MSKTILLALFAMVAVSAILAAPMEEFVDAEPSEGVEAFSEQDFADAAEDHLRFRRVTCDLLSFGDYAAHTACAANCLTMGKAGGRCNDGVCQCRKTNMKDLWDKRFG